MALNAAPMAIPGAARADEAASPRFRLRAATFPAGQGPGVGPAGTALLATAGEAGAGLGAEAGSPRFRLYGGFVNAASAPLDSDGDGVPDATDNCTTVPNPGQEDVNAPLDDDPGLPGVQRYGDACDVDLDDDGAVGPSDFFGVFRPCMGAVVAALPTCAVADLDGDGSVGSSDFFGRLRPALGTAPGPGVTP